MTMSSPHRLAVALMLVMLACTACGARTDTAIECPAPLATTLRATWVAAPRRLDVVALFDVTGSMARELAAIAARADELAAALYGLAAEVSLQLVLVSPGTYVESLGRRYADPRTAAEGLSELRGHIADGGDAPEDQLAAVYAYVIDDRTRFLPHGAEPCAASLFGLGCLDPTIPRVFFLATDGPFHLGPGGRNPYPGADPQPPFSFETVVDLLQTTHTRIVAAYGNSGGVVAQDVEPLVSASGAVRADGSPIAFEGQDEAVVEASLSALAEWKALVPYELSVRVRVIDGDAGLVRSMRIAHISPTPTGAIGDHRASGVMPGAEVQVEVDVDPMRALPGVPAHIELQMLDGNVQVLDRVELVYMRPLDAFMACTGDGGL